MMLNRSDASLPKAGSMALETRALVAIAVFTPPGWTTVRPTPVPSSSWRRVSEKPRTANLLAT